MRTRTSVDPHPEGVVRVGELIDELKLLRDADGDHDLLQGQINYLEANRQRMEYQHYRDERLPIGSGAVESACKNVVAARMKGGGMTWTLPRANGTAIVVQSPEPRRA